MSYAASQCMGLIHVFEDADCRLARSQLLGGAQRAVR